MLLPPFAVSAIVYGPGGGLGILVGAFMSLVAGINAISITALILLAVMRGGIPDPLPGGDPLPDFQSAFLILAGTLTLLLGGAGAWSVDNCRNREGR